MRFTTKRSTTNHAISFAIGLIVFIVIPEGIRWVNGGALAQQSSMPDAPERLKLPMLAQNVPNNQGIVTFGQTGNNTLNVAPRYSQIGPSTIESIKLRIPAKSHVMVLRAVQGAATAKIADQLISVLNELGYNVDPIAADAFGMPYFKGVQLEKKGGSENGLLSTNR